MLPAVVRLPDAEQAVALTRRVASEPTVPHHEERALGGIERELARLGVPSRRDEFGQLFAHVSSGAAKRPVAIMAHTDHPGFEVVEARGKTGRVRVLGGLQARLFAQDIAVVVYGKADAAPIHATLDAFEADRNVELNSVGLLRITADGELEVGMFAVLDMPAFERDGDALKMRAADDLAGCAMSLLAVAALAKETRPFDVHVIFTRAEETGLYGARIAAEDGAIPADAYVISIEASRELPSALAGKGIVVRAGDYHNTFSNEAERTLRVARERLQADGVETQRALLTGGTCEASAFVSRGYLATGVALPNVNYHNVSPDDRFVPEIVSLSDLRSGVALLSEAVVATAEDAVESWWPSNRVVPRSIREMLSRGVR